MDLSSILSGSTCLLKIFSSFKLVVLHQAWLSGKIALLWIQSNLAHYLIIVTCKEADFKKLRRLYSALVHLLLFFNMLLNKVT